ncbi:MAG: hypothetical protein J6U16_09750, partial [Ruminococcus sp.]|nr:hypothetical protein [Ruminococcus sp.]
TSLFREVSELASGGVTMGSKGLCPFAGSGAEPRQSPETESLAGGGTESHNKNDKINTQQKVR